MLKDTQEAIHPVILGSNKMSICMLYQTDENYAKHFCTAACGDIKAENPVCEMNDLGKVSSLGLAVLSF